jgi:electron transport complex protein RnfG
MKKLSSNILNMVVVLSGIAIFAAVTLTYVYSLTKEQINNSQAIKQQEAIRTVLPPFDHLDSKPIIMNDGVETMKVYKAYDKMNNLVGAAVETSSNNGYKGHIDIMVGFDKHGVIYNYTVLEQNETPGLGSKMIDWFKTKKGNQNILGKNPATANLSVTKTGGEVDAITAATISSKAFLFAIRNAYFAFTSNIESSTQQAVKDTINNNIEMKGQK